ncbi:protein kinase [Myxococcota bacterium]|nr:protein kinase [Myxococcota bacterium]
MGPVKNELKDLSVNTLMHDGENGTMFNGVYHELDVVIKFPGQGSTELEALQRMRGVPGILHPLVTGLWHSKTALVFPLAMGDLYGLSGAAQAEGLGAFRSMCEGIDEIHARGWLHRDIHPGNVLRVNNEWLLSDFGIARPMGKTSRDGSHGLLRFASLNQLKSVKENQEDDLYSLVLTLHFALTGKLPWKDLHGVTLFSRKQEIPPELSPRHRKILRQMGHGGAVSALSILSILSQ